MATKNQEDDQYSMTIPFLVDSYADQKHDSCHDLEKQIKITGTTSFFKTTFNGLNTLLGIAILSTPYALSCGGWLSLILLFVIACSTLYTGLLMKRCMDIDSNIRSYPDIGDKAFGSKGRLLVSMVMNLELYLLATGFLILVGDNLQNMFPNVEINVYGVVTIGGRQTFVLLVAIVIMPTVWIKDLSSLSYVSATGVLASTIILVSVLWSGIFDGVGFHQRGEFLNWRGLPTALSLYTLCYCGHPVFPTIYTSMRNRRQFSWVLFICFMLCTVISVAVAILGYMMFGAELESQITLNMPKNKLSSKVATYTALINPISKYALLLKPIVDAIDTRFQCFGGKSLLIRSMLVGSTVIVALAMPFYGDLMSLVGAFTSVMASILLPCLCYFKISGGYRKFGFESVIISFILFMGLITLVIGTYTSLIQIVSSL